MNRFIKASFFIGCFLWSTVASSQDAATVTGEVLDLSCYLTQGAKGPDHAQCAKACVKGGQPMGLLAEDGTVFLLGAGEDKDQFAALKELAGEMAEVTGSKSERGGMKMVVVEKAKKAGT